MNPRGKYFYRYVLLIASFLAATAVQRVTFQGAFAQASDLPDVYKMKGKEIAHGNNTRPLGPYQLKTYRIVEVQLPKANNVTVNGHSMKVDRAYKIEIIATRGSIPVRNEVPILLIGDTELKNGQESEDLSSITFVTYDRTVLKNGATISFSFGQNEGRTTLPDKLKLGNSR